MNETNAEVIKFAKKALGNHEWIRKDSCICEVEYDVLNRLIEQAERAQALEKELYKTKALPMLMELEKRKYENKRLREALEFYADTENNLYIADYPGSYLTESKVMEDDGNKARQALKGGVQNGKTHET